MKAWALMIAMVLAASVHGQQIGGPAETTIVACTDLSRIHFAAQEATAIFATISVRLDWRTTPSCASLPEAVEITFKSGAPEQFRPGVLAYAFPFEGSRVVILNDRVANLAASEHIAVTRLMAYVLVHEMTHILQRVDIHSPEGIMKARWAFADTWKMRLGTLSFTPDDIELIRLGCAATTTKSISASARTNPAIGSYSR